MEKYKEVFKPVFGTLKQMEAKIRIVDDAETRIPKSSTIRPTIRPESQRGGGIGTVGTGRIAVEVDYSDWPGP